MLLSTLGTLTLGYFGLLWATLGYFGLLLATFLTICVTYGSIIQCDFLKKSTITICVTAARVTAAKVGWSWLNFSVLVMGEGGTS